MHSNNFLQSCYLSAKKKVLSKWDFPPRICLLNIPLFQSRLSNWELLGPKYQWLFINSDQYDSQKLLVPSLMDGDNIAVIAKTKNTDPLLVLPVSYCFSQSARITAAQWEGMGDVGSARYEPALLPPCPTIKVLSYSNCQRFTRSISTWIFRILALCTEVEFVCSC